MDYEKDMTDERPYSKREMDSFKDELRGRLDNQDKVADATLTQAKTTNGRVNKLEALTKGIIMSGTVVVFMGGVIVGLVVYIYQYQLTQQSTRITNLKSIIQTLQEK